MHAEEQPFRSTAESPLFSSILADGQSVLQGETILVFVSDASHPQYWAQESVHAGLGSPLEQGMEPCTKAFVTKDISFKSKQLIFQL